jgi:hypothetical protein
MLGAMGLGDDVRRIAEAAERFAAPGERVEAVLAAEPKAGELTFLCAYNGVDGNRAWLALERDGEPVTRRSRVRDAVSIAAMCEVAEEALAREPATAPRLACPAYLDRLGGNDAGAVAAAIQAAAAAVGELGNEVEETYKLELA